MPDAIPIIRYRIQWYPNIQTKAKESTVSNRIHSLCILQSAQL
jgi:hypothetical protein